WYPSSSATNSDAEPSGDAGLTRLGHAFAATCFALIAVIGVIGLVQQGRAVRQAQAEQDGVATKIAEVREEVLGLDKRVASVESRVEGGAESADRLAHRLDDRGDGRVTPETTSPGVPPAPVIALPLPPTSREERPGPPSPPRPEPDLKTKIREDWETTNRYARNAANEIKDAFRRFRDWISP